MLTNEERGALEEFVRGEATMPKMARRARIVLACATGITNVLVATQLGLALHHIEKWRCRFVRYRLGGLYDQPQVGDEVSRVILAFETEVVRAVKALPCTHAALHGALVRVVVRLP